ncbi:lipopolysaccharide biosynthesis protein [Curtobacterium sp. AB451]|uniref:lipopolysaccharide biosynthesis protein n=1 Tax=Curtobacterium sp. AB451 TaxID=3422306 RepID=UPI003D351490
MRRIRTHRVTARRLPAVAVILSGTLIGQGTVIAVSPLLTRAYGPSDFGALAVITALCSILGAFATTGTDRALMVAPTDRAVRHLVLFGLMTSAVVAGAVGAAAWSFRNALAAGFDAPSLAELWWLFPLTTVAISAFRIVSATVARRQRYTDLATRNAVQGLAQTAWNLLAAPLGPVGLLAGLSVGRLAGVLGSLPGSRRRMLEASASASASAPASVSVSRSDRMAATLGAHRRFLLVTPWSALLNVLGQQGPSVLIALALGSTSAGYVALTMRVLGTPVGMLADAVAQWSGGVFGRSVRSGTPVDRLLRRIVLRLAVAGAAGTLLVLVFAPTAFSVVFGSQWTLSGTYAQVLVPAFAVQVVASPVTQLLSLLGRQLTQLWWDGGRLVLTSGSVLVTTAAGASPGVTVAALSASMVVAYAVVLVLVRRAVRAHRIVATSTVLAPPGTALPVR